MIRCHGNWLIVSRIAWIPNFTVFQVIFHASGSIINFPLTVNDLCHSQPNGIFFSLFLMPVVQYIVAQWRHISSESAVALLFSFPLNCVNI